MADREYIQANDESRQRLAELVETMTPARLATDVGGGWTVATAIGHMAFMDRWHGARWERMLAGEWSADSASVREAEHLALETMEPFWPRVSSTGLPDVALEAASRVDDLIAGAPDDLVNDLKGTPYEYLLHRFSHRNEHIDQIERALIRAEAAAAAEVPDLSFVERNQASLDRLRQLSAGLDPADLMRETEKGGWTIGHVLGHLAFWDRFMASRWKAALQKGSSARPADMPHDLADLLNDALAPTWQAMAAQAPEALAVEVLAAAEEIDGIVASLPPDVPVAEIQASLPRQLDRSLHRLDHIGQVEKAWPRKG